MCAFVLFTAVIMSCFLEHTEAGPDSSIMAAEEIKSPLQLAQELALTAPRPKSQSNGELEDMDWWEINQDILRNARTEYGQKHPSLYIFNHLFESIYINEKVSLLVNSAYKINSQTAWSQVEVLSKIEEEIRSLVSFTEVEGVFKFPLFNEKFCKELLEELKHFEKSGIPIRRPNGMNRYGANLDDLGFDNLLEGVVTKYIKPIAQMLFPEDCIDDDFQENYGFTIRYRLNEDTSLAEHADASTITMNLCLGYPGFKGGELLFGDVRFREGNNKEPNNDKKHSSENCFGTISSGASVSGVEEKEAINENLFNRTFIRKNSDIGGVVPTDEDCGTGYIYLHLGQHMHSANRITFGERANLILWMYGAHGVVRVMPYEKSEQSSSQSRWRVNPPMET